MAASKGSGGNAKKDPIQIKPENAGKLRATAKVKDGQKIPASKLEALKNSPDPKTRARANFAINARSWGKSKKG